jgi:imidazoleglycerol-phosphate dehydratase/histidinol-phosphatase
VKIDMLFSQTEQTLFPVLDFGLQNPKKSHKGVVVFDRDGTLVEDAGQHNNIKKLVLLPRVEEALKLLTQHDYKIAVATNQAGVSTGKFSLQSVFDFNNLLRKRLYETSGVRIELFAVCPHSKESNCLCRKPKIGLLEAIQNSGMGKIQLFVGNSDTDRAAAEAFLLEYADANHSNLFQIVSNWLRKNAFG